MRRVRIVALATFLAAPGLAQPTPSCPGDCNLDGVVGINELLRGVNFFLDGLPPAGCDELDDNRDGAVRVNELVLAVVKALGPCRLMDDAAAEAAAGAAVGAADAFDIIDLGSAAAGGGGSGTDVAALDALATVTTNGTGGPCSGGGTRDEFCEIRSGAARLTVVFDRCVSRTDALSLEVDGRMVRTVDDVKFCDNGMIGDGVEAVDAFTDFRETIRRPNESGPDSVFELAGTFTRRFRFDGTGCAGRKGSEVFDGDLRFRCTLGAGTSAAGCPIEGRDLALTARRLTVVRDATGEVGDCDRIKTLIGRLESRDGVSGQSFDAVYRQLFVRQTTRANATDVQLEGGVALDCLGEVAVTTEVPLRRVGGERCPAVGLLQIRLPDGLERAVRYVGGGVEIDLDGDGKGDVKAESCEDPVLAFCQ